MENISSALLDWFYKNQRSLPFRTDPSPYHVWLSEIMLQQTRVSAALPYYERFLAALPDIPALAGCEEEKLHKLWEGLGYYSRVRNLQKAARIVCEQYGGQLPADYDALRALPGIGDYTAGAIASISFGIPVPAVDGNVLRVFSRLYNDPAVVTEPAVKKAFTARVMEHQPPDAAGDYNQALMELGALVCVPNGAPLCEKCPLAAVCRARAADTAPELPHKAAPKPRRTEPVTLALLSACKASRLARKQRKHRLPPGGIFPQQQRRQRHGHDGRQGRHHAGDGGVGGKRGKLPHPAAARKRPAGRAVAAGAVGGRSPCCRRGPCPTAGHGAGYGLCRAGRPARRKAYLQPYRVAHERHPAASACPRCPGRLRLGQPGGFAGGVYPARCI